MTVNKDYLQLHGLVFLSSLIPAVAIRIPIPSVEIVFLRTLMAVMILGLFILIKKINIKLDRNTLLMLLFSGILTAIYWILLVVSAKISNASVCLVGIATSPLWVTFISPIFTGKKIDFYQFMTGLNAVFGVYMIFSSGFDYEWGLAVAITGAVFGALLTVVNSKFAKSYPPTVITFYQMIGAWTGTVMMLPLYIKYLAKDSHLNLNAGTEGFILIFILAFVFSVVAYAVLIRIMKKVSPFTIALTTNLQPIYGIIVALIVFGKSELMTIYFYSGAIIIIASVTAFPLVSYFFRDSLPDAESVTK
jgi:drug/metabolite transporter (DMT)-like permease